MRRATRMRRCTVTRGTGRSRRRWAPRPGRSRWSKLDEMSVPLCAGGTTVRDLEHPLVSTLGVDLSHETISNITEEIADEVLAWQSRPLEVFYPVIYLDA